MTTATLAKKLWQGWRLVVECLPDQAYLYRGDAQRMLVPLDTLAEAMVDGLIAKKKGAWTLTDKARQLIQVPTQDEIETVEVKR